jgi:hypothetical protein
MPSPSDRFDHGYVQGILGAMGALTGITASGEEQQLDFVGKGTVIVQSSELALKGRSNLAAILGKLPGLQRTELDQLFAQVQLMTRR